MSCVLSERNEDRIAQVATCRKCGEECELPAYRAAKRDYRCRPCINIYEKQRCAVNPQKRKRTPQKRQPSPRTDKTRAQARAYRAIYRATHPGQNKEIERRSYLRRKADPINSKKLSARRTLRDAVRRGRVQKQPCKICGHAEVEGHHPDYSKPYDVIWLCRPHHHELHKAKPTP